MADELGAGLEGLEAGPAATAAESGSPASAGDWSGHPSVQALRAHFGEAVLRHEVVAGDEHVVHIAPERALEILGWLKQEPSQAYDLLVDLTAVDFGGGRPLQVVYQLWSIPNRRALRVKAELPLRALAIDSVVPLWATADWLEREVYDMFGIQFDGHPDLRRILMPENYEEGHPLRKDFPLRGRFSRAEQTRLALAMDTEDYYIPQELAFRRESDPGGSPAGEAAGEPEATPPPDPARAQPPAGGAPGTASGGA